MIFKIVYFKKGDFYRRYPQMNGQDQDGRSNLGFSTNSMKRYDKNRIKKFILDVLYGEDDAVVFDLTSQHLVAEIRSDLETRVEKAKHALERLPSK
jgi:hypothetical protein